MIVDWAQFWNFWTFMKLWKQFVYSNTQTYFELFILNLVTLGMPFFCICGPLKQLRIHSLICNIKHLLICWLIFFVIHSVWVMMNKLTRKLSKIPEEVRGEIGSFFMDSAPILEEDSRKLSKLDDKTADYIRSGLSVSLHFFCYCYHWFLFSTYPWCCFLIRLHMVYFQPRWSDLDVNQHVNNVKYIGWILEVVFRFCSLIWLQLLFSLSFFTGTFLAPLVTVLTNHKPGYANQITGEFISGNHHLARIKPFTSWVQILDQSLQKNPTLKSARSVKVGPINCLPVAL